MRADVVIVGGGITGLSTAFYLDRAWGSSKRIVVLEGSERFGGNIRSERRGGLTLDLGPDAWVTTKPQATELARTLELDKEILTTPEKNRKVYIAQGSGLLALPPGLVLGIPTALESLRHTSLFSLRGKARIAADLVLPRRSFDTDEDESIAQFVTRRLGHEACDRIVAPLLSGIFSGDADELSIRAGFPQLVAMERDYGSLIRGARAQRRARAEAGEKHTFFSLDRGIHRLVERLIEELGRVTLRTRAPVRSLRAVEGGWEVILPEGERLVTENVVLTAPAYVLAPMLTEVSARLASSFAELRYGSTALVFLAFPRAAVGRDLDATGFLVPRSTGSDLVASTWISSKWEGRAPESTALFRLFFGGSRGPEVLGKSDEELLRLGIAELGRFVPLRGEPTDATVHRCERASPQPRTGHLRWLADVRAELGRHRGLHLAGNGYGGVGIPDCIRQAKETVATLTA
jgi:protoporphyrinogen/coproporphyrinogen III oxidase